MHSLQPAQRETNNQDHVLYNYGKIIQDVKNSFAGKPQEPLIKKPERLPERRLHRFPSELGRICLLYNELDSQVKNHAAPMTCCRRTKKT